MTEIYTQASLQKKTFLSYSLIHLFLYNVHVVLDCLIQNTEIFFLSLEINIQYKEQVKIYQMNKIQYMFKSNTGL